MKGLVNMAKAKDITGQKFGYLTVISRAENDKYGGARWLCKCDCGKKKTVLGTDLRTGNTKTCGCTRINYLGLSQTRAYRVWSRLVNSYVNKCVHYKGRRITLYHEWYKNFQAFYDYVSKLPHFGEEGYKFFRINKDRDYAPGNVCWGKPEIFKCKIFVKYQGKIMTLKQASQASGITQSTLFFRYRKGYRGVKLFRSAKKIIIEYNGEKMSLYKAAKVSGIALSTLKGRYIRGDRGERLFRSVEEKHNRVKRT